MAALTLDRSMNAGSGNRHASKRRRNPIDPSLPSRLGSLPRGSERLPIRSDRELARCTPRDLWSRPRRVPATNRPRPLSEHADDVDALELAGLEEPLASLVGQGRRLADAPRRAIHSRRGPRPVTRTTRAAARAAALTGPVSQPDLPRRWRGELSRDSQRRRHREGDRASLPRLRRRRCRRRSRGAFLHSGQPSLSVLPVQQRPCEVSPSLDCTITPM